MTHLLKIADLDTLVARSLCYLYHQLTSVCYVFLPHCSVRFTRMLYLCIAQFATNFNPFTANPVKAYTLPYCSNPPFLIFDIRALWRSGLSATAPECQKLKMMG